MNIEILGVPDRFSNADGIDTPSSVQEPVQNSAADGGVSAFMSSADAHAALKALALQDGWWALYDPTNDASLTKDGSGNVTSIADSLGNGPTLTLITGDVGKTPVSIGSLRGIRSVFWADVSEQDFFAMGAGAYHSQGLAYLLAGIGPSTTDGASRAYALNTASLSAKASRSNENANYRDVLSDGTNSSAPQRTSVWGFDTASGDIYYGKHLLTPDEEPDQRQISRPNGICIGVSSEYGKGIAGPVLLAQTVPSKETRLRMTDMLTKLSGAPVTISTDDSVAVDAYATLDEAGNLVAAYRPFRPVQMASVVKVMMAHVARKYVTDAMLDDLVTVVDPYQPTDNRYPSVYAGDTMTWRDLFTITNHASHNRLSSTIAYQAEKIRRPTASGTVQDIIGTFLAHAKGVADQYGWGESVFETPNGYEDSILSPLHTAELFHRIWAADPWLTAMMGTPSASFTINHVARAGNPASVETGTVTNIVQSEMGGYQYPELIMGKGGNLLNPSRNTLGTLWRDPATGKAHATMYATGGNGYYADRVLGTRRVWDADRNRYPSPDHWSTPGVGSVCLWGRESSNSYAVLAKDPNAESWDSQPSILPFDTGTDPLPIVRKGDTVSWSVRTKRPVGLGAASKETLSIKIVGGLFANGKDSVTSTVSGSAASSWTLRTVTSTVQRGGVLTPSLYMEYMDDSAALWARDAVLTITTPAGKTSVYRMDAEDYSIGTDSMPLDLSNMAGSVGDFNVRVQRPELESIFSEFGHRYLYGKRVRILTQRGTFYGTVTDADMTNRRSVGIIGALALGPLNAYNVSAPPFTGMLGELIQLYIGLVAESAPSVSVDPAIGMRPVTYPGWAGDLWPMMKNLCAAHDIQITPQEDGSIHFGPGLDGEYHPVDYSQLHETGNPQTLARAVEVVRYKYDSFKDQLVYPAGGWSEEVENITVSPGDTVTYTLNLETSITDFVQPMHVDYVDRMSADQSVYSIVDETGRTVTAADWKIAGGSVTFGIGPDRQSILMRISAPTRIMLDDINQAVQSYTFGSRFGDASSQYSTVRIIGSGVGISSTLLRIPTGVERELTGSEVGVTIDNPFISTMGQAGLAGLRAAITYAGQRAEVSLDTQTVPAPGVLVKGERMDYRQRSTRITPSGVVTQADYHLQNDTHQAGFEGMTNADVEDWYAGLTFAEAQNRGIRGGGGSWISYDWLGTPDASASVKKIDGVEVARNIALDPRATNPAWFRSTGTLTAESVDGVPCIKTTATSSSYQQIVIDKRYYSDEEEFQVGDKLHWSADIKVTLPLEMVMRVTSFDGGAITDEALLTAQLPTDGWVRHFGVFTVTAAPSGSYFNFRVHSTPQSPATDGFYFKNLSVQRNSDEPYFDGSMQGHDQ